MTAPEALRVPLLSERAAEGLKQGKKMMYEQFLSHIYIELQQGHLALPILAAAKVRLIRLTNCCQSKI
jgi:hypothetical protein